MRISAAMHRPKVNAAIVMLAILAAEGCGQAAPGPSHVASHYRGKLPDDTLMEASTTVLVTRKDVVIALDCRPVLAALRDNDASALERAVAAGTAARLPADVTMYTPPFSPRNPKTAPLVVTDDKYGGTLCTPDAVDVVKSS